MEQSFNQQQHDLRSQYMQAAKHFHETKVPIYKGCPNKGIGECFCPGTCREIIGYRDKITGEN